MDDLISVIVPVYNLEKYIGRCIESILRQSYVHFELIIVNDGSKDSSLEICKKYAEEDKRIRVVDRLNGGASAARNSALEIMQGKYVVFVDGDDWVSENYLENLYDALKIGNFDIVQCNYLATKEMGVVKACSEFNKRDVLEITKTQALNDGGYKVVIWGKIYSARIFDNFRFKEGTIYEDDASYYIFVNKAKKIAILKETLYYYFLSNDSVMRNEKKEKSIAFIEIYEERMQYFIDRCNYPLLEGTYGRCCKVLIAWTADSIVNHTNINDIAEFIKYFKKYYSKAMKSNYVRKKDKILFVCFNLSPRIVGYVIGRIRN